MTLNERYNEVLEQWKSWGDEALPECECCGADMHGKDVIEGRSGWYCSNACRRECEWCSFDACDERKAEAKQLGFTALD